MYKEERRKEKVESRNGFAKIKPNATWFWK